MFTTILYPDWERHEQPRQKQAPSCFKDLNLDQILLPLYDGEPNSALADVCFTPLSDPEVISYRQDILRDFENENLRGAVNWFTEAIWPLNEGVRHLREALTNKTTYENDDLSRGALVRYVGGYCMIVDGLAAAMQAASPASQGMREFRQYVLDYAASGNYIAMRERIGKVRAALNEVKYCLYLKGYSLRVRKYEDQPELAPELEALFQRFRDGDAAVYQRFLPELPSCRDTEVSVLRQVSGLFPKQFGVLNDFCAEGIHFVDETLLRFALEVRFYLGWLKCTDELKASGLPLCFPELSGQPQDLYANAFYDLALARRKGDKVVTNDFQLTGPERIMVVTGANQGGKTTFARSFGQAHWLGCLGLTVPGRSARLMLFDKILTHFEKEEDLNDLSGKLQDDLKRLKAILDAGTGRSIYIINEIYSSTTLVDATTLGGRMMDAIAARGGPAVVVTFLDSLSAHGPETVSMVAGASEEAPDKRTYKVVRRPSDGLAFAMHLAANHGLTYEQIKRRLAV